MRGWRRIRDLISDGLRVPRRWLGHPDLRALNRRADRSRRDVEKLLQRLHPGVGCEVVSGPGTSHLEAGCYSQNGEDGVLLHILSTAGVDQRSIVEIGCGAAVECNSSALLCGFGWSGVLFDREPQQVKSARSFFEERGVSNRVEVLEVEVQPDTIDALLAERSEPDVLSIDVDGYDFWIWKHLTAFRPRVVVIEVNASFGPSTSCTIPWSAGSSHHDAYRHHVRGWHHGASLVAMEALGRSKGYRLVAVESTGTNAFFLREDLAVSDLPPLDPGGAWRPHRVRSRRHSPDRQAMQLQSLPSVLVESDGSAAS